MSTSTIKLAFRDIKNMYKSFIYLLIILSGFSFLFIPLFSSIYHNYINENELKPSPFKVHYAPVVTSLENNDDLSKLTKDLDKLYAKDVFTYFNSSKLSEDFGYHTYIVDGRGIKDLDNSFYWIVAQKVDKESIEKYTNEYKIDNSIEKMNFLSKFTHLEKEELSTLYNILKVEDSKWQDFQAYDIKKNEIMEIVDHSKLQDELLKDKVYEKMKTIFKGSFLSVAMQVATESVSEEYFILTYMVPYVIFLLALLVAVFVYFYNNLFTELEKEYDIHYIFGAKNKDIFLRNQILIISILFINFALMNYLNGFNIDHRFTIIACVTMFYYIIFTINLLHQIYKKNQRGVLNARA
ncbi:hypothetical protein [Helcococcus massiliensis]|uniref:hypothetical protein n=1 Tax=Helcococcus massiliensis TaxID=2040290 RepID=UPI000CDED5CC|nr:hypothetical protein [Helcococcus massiliensis]